MKFQIEQIQMVRKHKSEDQIDTDLKKEMIEQKWEKPEKEDPNAKE